MASEFHSNSLNYPAKQDNQLSRPVYAEIVAGRGSDETTSGLLHYWQMLYRSKGKIFLLAALGAGCGYLVVLPQTPVYRASTSLEVLDVNNSFLNIRNLDPTVQENSLETRLHTEMKMLQSTSLVRQVAEKLQQSDTPIPRVEPDRLSTILTNAGLPPLKAPSTRRSAIRMAGANLKIRNPDLTRIVEISCESTHPNITAEFANLLTQTYMEQSVEGRLNNAQRTREWLDSQIEEVRTQLEKSNAKLVAYAQASGLTLGSEATEKLRKLQEQLSQAQGIVMEKLTEYEVAKAGSVENLPQFQQDDGIKLYSQRLIEKNNELSELRTALSPAHYKVKRLEAQQDDLKRRLEEEKAKIVQRIAGEFARAKLREEMQAKAYVEQSRLVTDQSRKMIYHSMLQGEVETYRQLYDAMLQRVKEGAIASAMRASNVRVVDKAEVPKSPYRPEPIRSVLTGFSTGFSLAIVLVFLRNSSDRLLRNPGEASAYLNIRELGSIPSASEAGLSSRKLRLPGRKPATTNTAENGAGHVNGASQLKDSVELITWVRNPSPQAESFRSVLVSLLSRSGDQKLIVMTSPNAGDGKTSVVSNLGIALTEVGRRVLLIDADLRRPRLHEVFNLPNACGLSDLVAADTPIDRYPVDALAKPTLIPQLYLLPSGPGTRNIARLLYSRRTRDLLARLQEEFDVVLIDTPPMLQYPDARILARFAGGAVLVLRAGSTDRDTGKRAVERLTEDGVVIFGAVLNDWNPKESGQAYGRDYTRNYDRA